MSGLNMTSLSIPHSSRAPSITSATSLTILTARKLSVYIITGCSSLSNSSTPTEEAGLSILARSKDFAAALIICEPVGHTGGL